MKPAPSPPTAARPPARTLTAVLFLLASLSLPLAGAQSTWPAGSVSPLPAAAFDVASVRPGTPGAESSSTVPLGPGDVLGPGDGVLRAQNLPLITYLAFAYKLTDYQIAYLRESARPWVLDEPFTIAARTERSAAAKDDLRMMMQALLADRFALRVHTAPRLVPVFTLSAVTPGATGPKLQPHPPGSTCAANRRTPPAQSPGQPAPPETGSQGFPIACGGIVGVPAGAPDRYSFGARDVPMSLIAGALSSWGALHRPVLDRTGLSGNFDFVLDFTPDPRPSYATSDSGGPTFVQALRQQLGLRLEAGKGEVAFLSIDRVEHPAAN